MKINQLKTLVPQLHKALGEKGKKIVISNSYAIPVDVNNFYEIPTLRKDNNQDSPNSLHNSSPKIIFIDGGNQEIIGGVNFSLQMIRRAALIYQNNKQIDNQKDEFFSLTTIVPKNNTLFFETSTTPDTIRIPVYNIHDRSLAPQGKTPSVSLIADITRRFSELQLAFKMLDKLGEGDALIIDGLLSPHFTGEEMLTEQLLTHAKEKGIVLLGLAKTSRLMTEKGSSAMDALLSCCPEGTWRYSYEKSSRMTTHFIRLHEKSKHVFRLEVPKYCEENIDIILAHLVNNSSDPIFLGYPYGLMATDRFARVVNREKEYLKIALQSIAGKDYKELAQSLRAINAHEILDSV